jgi:phage tail-like protein
MLSTRPHLSLIVLIGVLAAPLSGAPAGQKGSGNSSYVFAVKIDGLAAGAFREVRGLGVETEITELREGGSNEVRKVPGRVKFPNVTLNRGLTGSRELFEWATSNLNGKGVRRSVTITVSDPKGSVIAEWILNRAFPAKWTGPDLDASTSEVLIETLEIAHEGLTMSIPKK